MGGTVSAEPLSPVDIILQKNINLKNEDILLNKVIDSEKANFSTYRSEGLQTAKAITDLLQQSGQLSVARHCVAGSIGKRSALGSAQNPDFDVVVFLNVTFDRPTDLKNIMTTKQEVFKQVLDSAKKGYNCRIGKNALGVTTSNKTELDLVPAVSFHKSHIGGSPIEIQWRTVLDMEYHQGSNLPWLCSSLAEKVVEYVDTQPNFVNRVVILAKMWKANRVGDVGYVPGASTIVELVAVKAAQEELKRSGSASPTLALVRVLVVFAKPVNEVQVVFDDVRFPILTATEKFNKMKNNKGILLDPVNPYNNFLQDEEGRVKSAWPKIRKVAQESLQDIENYLKAREIDPKNEDNVKLIHKIVYGESSSFCSIM